MHDEAAFIAAALGGGVALAGLLLIFSGFLFAQAAIMPPETDDALLRSYKTFARIGLVPFTLSLLVAAAATAWFDTSTTWLCGVVFWAFITLIVLTIVYGILATRFL